MMITKKLFMILLGATPKGRLTEQHDIFFGIAENIKDLKEDIINSWPEAKNQTHIDAWREVNVVDNYSVSIFEKGNVSEANLSSYKLFFINLGGYKENEFDEFHYKTLIVAENKSSAIKKAKETVFYKHTGFKKAESHIDDKYGIDVDDVYDIKDILNPSTKEQYGIQITPAITTNADPLHLGYFMLEKL